MIKRILKENCLFFLIILLLIVVFLILKYTPFYSDVVVFDNKVFSFLNMLHVNKFTHIMKVFTNIGDWYIPISIIVCSLVFFKNKNYFYILAGSYLFAGIVSFAAKWIILRPRPIDALIKIPTSYSFPSGHTLTSLVFYLTLCYLLTKNIKGILRPILLFGTVILILMVALSRVYLGVHFCSDVIGGFLFGIVCEVAVINTIKNNFSEKK